MSLRLVSSAKNLREQFKGTGSSTSANSNLASSGSSSSTANNGNPNGRTIEFQGISSSHSSISRQGTLLRSSSSNGNLRRAKSVQKKTLMAKVFTDDGDLTELSMEMTLVVVKRCVREIRERGLTTKGILRQVQMGYNQKVVMDTIRMILDDDASTELSPLHRVDIHLVAHAMKWAIRSSEETLVKYTDYQTLYLDQDRSFSCFVRGLPPTNRAILLDLFSLCADVTLLAHLNNMTLVTVAKAISLSIMAEPEQFSTFDASLQQRNLWGAACEDLLRAFLRIKTTHDLAKIEQEDDIDENRYVDNITRKVKSARQRNEVGPTTGSLNRSGSGVYDPAATPRSASPHSLAKSNSTRSGPITQLPFYDQEYEEIMQDQAHLSYLRRQSRNSQLLRPADRNRRRSSVGDVESLYMLPVDTSTDGYESEPEPSLEGLAPDFAGDLDWDFTKMDALHAEELPSSSPSQCTSIYRSNSISSIDSASTKVGQAPPSPMISGVPSKRSSNSASALQQGQTDASSSPFLSPLSSTQQSASAKVRIVLDHASPSMSPQRAKRSSLLRRSVSLDPHTMHGRVHKKPNELRQEILTRELAVQAERSQVAEDIRTQLLQVKNDEDQSIPSPTSSTFSFESASQDLERPAIPSRSASQGLGRSYSKTIAKSAKTNAKLGANDGLHSKKLSVGNTNELTSAPNSSNASIISQSSSSSDEYKPEVVSRPKDGEVSVHFTPIAPLPHKSKFQESLSEQPISPPPGYTQGLYQYKDTHKKSPSTKGGQSGTSSPIQSQPVSRSNSRSQPNQHSASTTPLQQVVGSSSASSHSSESKSKAAGFIRALSYKLRSKPSEEQLKSSKTNNQVVGGSPPPPPPPPPPSFSIQPPRLELSFLGNTGISNAGSSEDNLPPTSAPATMLHARSNSGSSTLGSWRRAAQDSLPVPATSTDHLGVGPPKGTSPGNVNTKQQRRRSKTVTASDERSPHRSASERTLSESSYTTDDSGSVKDSSKKDGLQSSTTDPKKAGEREYRFSTATLLKDGKLYYQLQWDSFSESGFKSDFFSEPEQYLTGLHQKRMSRIGTNTTTSGDHTSEAIVGHGHSRDTDPGPSRAQREAAMKAARQSFMALAKDPKALAALKAGSTDGNGQATIIATGSFSAGSTQPVLQSRLSNIGQNATAPKARSSTSKPLTTTPVMAKSPITGAVSTTSTLSPKLLPYPRPSDWDHSKSNNGFINRAPPPYVKSDPGKPQKNISGRLSATPSATGSTSSDGKEIMKSGKQITTASNAGSSSSSSSSSLIRNPIIDRDPKGFLPNPAVAAAKSQKKSRLFGSKPKPVVAKKANRVSTSYHPASGAGITNSNLSSSNLTKKKKLPPGVVRKDLLTRTEESLDEVFPWTCIEHTTGQESGWVMLEPVQDGAVGWIKIDKLEEEINRIAAAEKKQQLKQQQQPNQMTDREQ